MKNFIIFLAIILFSASVQAFELPAGKTINKVAVQNGIDAYTKKNRIKP